ncbi:hypothetical protein [Methylocystis sp.]|uniref:hypothetical protein n=1 Tax=Methylocystis sp. TaxID=1911079 RepID=UPI0025D2455D|nr:hypothetical protein [Methylocystis sp.]
MDDRDKPGHDGGETTRCIVTAAVAKHRMSECLQIRFAPTINSSPSPWLDRAVAAAYDWPEDVSTEDALAKLLKLNLRLSA